MCLEDTFLRRGDATNLLLDTGDVLVLRIMGIDADSQENTVFRRDAPLNILRHLINISCCYRVLHLDMHRSDRELRAIVVQYEVIGSQHTRHGFHLLLDIMRELRVIAITEQFADRRQHHLHTSLDDDQGDGCAEPAVELQSEEHHHACRDQRRQ